MKLFVLLSRIPWPLEKGDKLRAFYQIKCLSQNNEIHLVALNDSSLVDKKKAFEIMQPYCKSIHFYDLSKLGILWNLGLSFFKRKPIQCGYFYNKKIHREIHNLILSIQPDMLFGQMVRVAPYFVNEPILKAIDYQDVLSMGMKRRMDNASLFKKPIFKMEYKRLLRYERLAFDLFDVKTIISDSDRQLINHPKKNEIIIVPNGVDFEHYKPISAEKKYDIIFSGNMAYPPNVNAVEYFSQEIMPLVWKIIPEATLCIAGATPMPSVKAVANDKIVVTGWVDDMREMYARSKIFVAPMRIGTGLQNKLLEAMSMQLPCITTPLANGSLLAKDGVEILIGKTAEQIANHIVTLLQNQSLASAMAQKGNEFVRNMYDWRNATAIMENAMKDSIAHKL